MKRVDVEQLSERVLILNLYATQAIVLAVACVLLWWHDWLSLDLWGVQSWTVWLWGCGTGLLIVCVDLLLTRLLPEYMIDQTGINEKLFKSQPVWHIFVMTLLIAFAEELLFRGALQPHLGIFWTSVLFTAIHFRYLKQWLMMTAVFFMSLGLGSLVLMTHSLMASTVAHFVVDFTLGVLIRLGKLDFFIHR